MGNRGDAFWNVLLRGVRDKHSNDLSIKKVMILKIGRGGGERGKKRIYFFWRISSMNRKIRSKASYKSWFSELLTVGDKEIREIINYNSISTGP